MIIRMIKIMMALFLLAPVLAQVDYDSEIQPIFDARCISCHGSMGGLNLTSYENLIDGGLSGDEVIPYDHISSELWQRINSGQMPPGNNDLTDTQVNLIAQWIDEGALEEPNCDPNLSCGEAETCCDGLLYPTTCCETNCDEPIGECGDDTLYGDLNDDGILNVLDVVIMVNMVLGNGYDESSDMNGDKIINVLDIVIMVNMVLDSGYDESADMNGDEIINVLDIVTLINTILS